MTNPLLIRTINDSIYSYMLSSSYRTAWVYEQSYALSKDADIWEVILRDTSFASSIDRFQSGTVRPFRIAAPKGTRNDQSKKAARIVEDGLRQCPLFDDMRRRLALGRILGRAYEYVNWDIVNVSLGGFPEMDWMLPVAYENIDRRRIRWRSNWVVDLDGSEKVETARELFSLKANVYQLMSRDFQSALIEEIYPLTEDRLAYGRGWLESTYLYAYFKAVAIEKMAQGMDRWANGMIVGKVDTARLASLPKSTTFLQSSFMTMLQTMRSEHIAVIDKLDEVEVHETSGTGHQICIEAIKYFDESVERLYNGSVRPAGHATQQGARAQSETESDTSEAHYQPYRAHLDEILTRDVVGFLWKHPLNRANFFRLGLSQAERPMFTSDQVKKKDPVQSAEIIAKVKAAGIPLLKSEVYDAIQFTQPEEDEDVFDGDEPVPVGGEGGFPGGEEGSKDGGKKTEKDSKDGDA